MAAPGLPGSWVAPWLGMLVWMARDRVDDMVSRVEGGISEYDVVTCLSVVNDA